MIQKCVNSLKIKKNRFLEELQWMFILLSRIGFVVEHFEYPNISANKVQSLVQEAQKKDELFL